MSSGLVLTGPPGIGKTTVARLVADVLQAVARSAVQFAAGGFHVVVDGVVGPWFLDPTPSSHPQCSGST